MILESKLARSESRQKTQLIQVRATPQEKAELKARAAAFGSSMSVGELCRRTIFSSIPKSQTDQNAISELAATRADLGRLGGLLKGWLSGQFAQATPLPRTQADVEALIQEIKSAQVKVLDAVRKVAGKP